MLYVWLPQHAAFKAKLFCKQALKNNISVQQVMMRGLCIYVVPFPFPFGVVSLRIKILNALFLYSCNRVIFIALCINYDNR